MTLDLEQKIRERAYQLWEQDGRVDGRADDYWFAATREVTATQATSSVQVLAQSSDIIVAEPAQPKTRRRKTAEKTAAPAAPAAPRRRRSSTPTLSS